MYNLFSWDGCFTFFISALTLGLYYHLPGARKGEYKIVLRHLITALIAEFLGAFYYSYKDQISSHIFLEGILTQVSALASVLWLNVLCHKVALPSMGDFLSYNVYVWGVTAIHTGLRCSILYRWGRTYGYDIPSDSINFMGFPLIVGVINNGLLVFALIRFIVLQIVRCWRSVQAPQGPCIERHRRLVAILILLLLLAPSCVVEIMLSVPYMKVLRAGAVFLFVFLKPEVFLSLVCGLRECKRRIGQREYVKQPEQEKEKQEQEDDDD